MTLLPPPPPPPARAAQALPPPPAPPAREHATTDWFPMRIAPVREGEYRVKHEDTRTRHVFYTREYWNGKRWPGMVGKFSAVGWCGLALEPKQ